MHQNCNIASSTYWWTIMACHSFWVPILTICTSRTWWKGSWCDKNDSNMISVLPKKLRLQERGQLPLSLCKRAEWWHCVETLVFFLQHIETLLGEFAGILCSSSQKSYGRTSKWTENKIDGLFISFNPWPGRWGEKAPLPPPCIAGDYSMISGAWTACCKKRKAPFGQNRKVNGQMCPIWHLQRSYQFLQHFEGPSSFCVLCRKVSDMVSWALRTHRTACNTAKPVNEALKSKICAPFTYHSSSHTRYTFPSIHLVFSQFFTRSPGQIKDVSDENTAAVHFTLSSHGPVDWRTRAQDTETHNEPRRGDIYVNGIPWTFHWPIDLWNPMDLSMPLFGFRLSPVTTCKFWSKESLPCTCATYTPRCHRMEIGEENMPVTGLESGRS